MWKKEKDDYRFKYLIDRDYRDNINLPIHEYDFFLDYDEKYFKNQYPRMWKHTCFAVEMNHWERVEKETIEFMRKFYLEDLIKDWINEQLAKIVYDMFVRDTEREIRRRKQRIAMRIMSEQIKKINRIKNDSESYILTEEEKIKKEKQVLKDLKDLYIQKIEWNWIYIELKWGYNLFRFKNWKEYIIDSFMHFRWGAKIDLRALEIIEACGEASLYYKWIAKIFRADERVMYNVLKPYWYNVNLSSKKELKTLDKIKVLDDSWFFIIEVENTKKQTN